MIDIASFGWPQWLYLAWFVFGLLMTAAKNGQDIKVAAPSQIIVSLIILIVLACGGFFQA